MPKPNDPPAAALTTTLTIADSSSECQFLLFEQGGSFFTIELVIVREVLCLNQQKLTAIPNTLPIILGLTNLRGDILPLIDFGCFIDATAVDPHNLQSRILVLEIADPRNSQIQPLRLGLVVSYVEGVVTLKVDQIVSAMDVSQELVPFLKGLYDYNGRFLMVLDGEAIAQFEHW